MFNLKNYLENKRKIINAQLFQLIKKFTNNPQDKIVQSMTYSLKAGGKRIRPILCLATAEALGDNSLKCLKIACCLEMIHTYSLIHDDLPALDDDDMRRGKLSNHKKFGEATAILAGDGLLTIAFQILTSIALENIKNNINLSTKFFEIIKQIAEASGPNGMIKGQMLDIFSEKKILSLQELKTLHNLKTGALVEASVIIGSIFSDVSTEKFKNLKIYAKNIGLAFQVTDDILNIEGDEKLMGKATGTDLDKNTFPNLMGLKKSKIYAKKLIDQAIDSIKNFDKNADPLRYIAEYIINRKK